MKLSLKTDTAAQGHRDRPSAAGFSRPAVFLLSAALSVTFVVLHWIINVPQQGFFVDVPKQVACIRDSVMHIQFPGYVPYHLLIALISLVTENIWLAAALVSLCAAAGAVIFTMCAARLLCGTPGAVAAGLVAASCVLTSYFAASGASYMVDALCASAVIYFGLENITTERRYSFRNAAAWFLAGVLLRPFSMACMFPGLLFLVYRKRPGAVLSLLMGGIFCCVVAFVQFSLPFYDSLPAFLASAGQMGNELQHPDWRHWVTNIFRWAGFPVYVFHVWILYIGWQCIRTRKEAIRPELVFILAATVLYDVILLRYIPHAGYLCLLMPAIIVLPMTFGKPLQPLSRGVVATFIVISLCQFHIAQRLPPQGMKTAVANAYFFQYSRAGIVSGRFETLSSELVNTGVETDKIPASRRAALEQQMNEPPP